MRRVYEHKNELIKGFSSKYKCKKLVYYEMGTNINSVIQREKQLKKWSRAKKLELIQLENKHFIDLSGNLL